ncbi:MAG: hypothetical protein WBF17_10490 [Phycisphaerae bacterium]
MLPWRNWFHCSGSTYGTWLRGDPRGWRSRHHREHVEGDYKEPPPPGKYDELHERSKRLMKHPEVFLDRKHRVIACREMAQSLLRHGVELIDLSVSAAHYHILARFTRVGEERSPGIRIPGLPKDKKIDTYEILKRIARHYVGIAKKDSARALSDAGLVAPGGVWTVRGSIRPIEDRGHQLRVAQYVRDHAPGGAAIWSRIGAEKGLAAS